MITQKMPGKGRHGDSDISSTGLYAAVAVAALGGAAVNVAVEKYRGLMNENYLLDKAFMDLSDAYSKAKSDEARENCIKKIKYWLHEAERDVNGGATLYGQTHANESNTSNKGFGTEDLTYDGPDGASHEIPTRGSVKRDAAGDAASAAASAAAGTGGAAAAAAVASGTK